MPGRKGTQQTVRSRRVICTARSVQSLVEFALVVGHQRIVAAE